MNLRDKISIASKIAAVRFLNRRIPLIIGWSLTNQCNYRCEYCGIPENSSSELSTGQVKEIMARAAGLGCMRIQFTGGEALMRDDIGEIIDKSHSLGIVSSLSTNGALVSRRIKDIEHLDIINLSLDGPAHIHDKIKEPGSFAGVMDAVKAAGSANIPFQFITVLSSENLDQIDYLLDLAKKFSTRITFQPATKESLTLNRENSIAPKVDEYRKVMEYLIAVKKRKGPVANSLSGFRHLLHWPDHRKIPCIGGRIFYRIESDGTVTHCQRYGAGQQGHSIVELGFKKAIEMVENLPCESCWSAPVVEAGCMFALKPDTLLNLATMY